MCPKDRVRPTLQEHKIYTILTISRWIADIFNTTLNYNVCHGQNYPNQPKSRNIECISLQPTSPFWQSVFRVFFSWHTQHLLPLTPGKHQTLAVMYHHWSDVLTSFPRSSCLHLIRVSVSHAWNQCFSLISHSYWSTNEISIWRKGFHAKKER